MRKMSRILALFLTVAMCFGMASCALLEMLGGKAKKLSAPTNVKVEDTVLSWNFVENAIGYTVKVIEGENADIENDEGEEIPVSETSYSLAVLADGNYTVGVKARGDGAAYTSSDYASVQYTRVNDTGEQYEDDVSGAFGSFDEINTRESYLGYGIDVINSTGVTSKNIKVTYPIFSKDAILNETLLKSNEHYSNLETIEASSIEEFKAKLASSSSISAGASASASCNIMGAGISGGISFSNGYKQSFEQTSNATYSQYFLEIIAENQNYWLMLQTTESRYKEILSDEFESDLYNVSISPAALFEKYGTHLVTSVAMGGNISMFYTLYSVDEGVTTEEYYEVASALKANAEVAYGSASAGVSSGLDTHDSQAYETIANRYGIRVEKKIVVSGGSGAFGITSEASLVGNYADWQKSLDTYPVVVGIKDSNSLYPIWDLIDRSTAEGAARYNELYSYFAEYGQESYDSLCDTFGIKPPVAPTGIDNIVVKSDSDYQDGEIVQIAGGNVFQITFDVLPDNANKYRKTFTSSSELVYVDENGNVEVSPEIENGLRVTITVTAGTVSKQIELIAVKSHNISFNTGFSDFTLDPITGITDGSYLDEPNLVREGYVLVGWFCDSGRTIPFDFENNTVESDLVLYAKWTPIKPVVTFDAAGGSTVASQTLSYGANAVRPADPTRSGYIFAGWFTDSSCVFPYDFLTGVTVDTTLYAKWTVREYTVSFVTNGGTEVAPLTTDVERGYLITEPTSTKTYYVLEGWYTDEGLTRRFYFSEQITSSITLYAKWSLKNIDVSFFDYDGSPIAVKYTDISNGFLVDAPEAPQRAGYVFRGWSFEIGGAVTDIASYVFSNETGGYKLYATWVDEAHAYPFALTVRYVYSDGTEAKASYVSSYYCDEVYSVESPYINGYRADQLTVEGSMPAENTTVIVTYSPAPYILTINYKLETDRGIVDAEEQKLNYSYGEEYSVNVPIRDGYTPNISVISGMMPAENVSATVIYSPNNYGITYDLNAESIKTAPRIDAATDTVTYNSGKALKIPYADYYVFDGWYTSDGIQVTSREGVPIPGVPGYTDADGAWVVIDSVTLRAKWTQLYAGVYVSEPADLDMIRNNPAASYVIISDINMSGVSFEPIPVFEGKLVAVDNHKIKNLRINATESANVLSVGFIADNCGTIENLYFDNCRYTVSPEYLKGEDVTVYCGIIAALNRAGGKIEGCRVTNSTVFANSSNVDDIFYLASGIHSKNLSQTETYNEWKLWMRQGFDDYIHDWKGKTCLSVYAGGITAVNSGLIDSCSFAGSVEANLYQLRVNGGYEQKCYAGGIAAYNAGEGEVANASVNASVSAWADLVNNGEDGLGWVGNISPTAYVYASGVVGRSENSNVSTLGGDDSVIVELPGGDNMVRHYAPPYVLFYGAGYDRATKSTDKNIVTGTDIVFCH